MTHVGIDIGCKWSGKANQWYTTHHMAGEDLGEGRMHARWATCSVINRKDLEQTRYPLDVEDRKGRSRVKQRVRIRRGRRKGVEGGYVNRRAD